MASCSTSAPPPPRLSRLLIVARRSLCRFSRGLLLEYCDGFRRTGQVQNMQ
jgi:hypothetical protein